MSEPKSIHLPDGSVIPVSARAWIYYCDECCDTGWKSWWCGPLGPNHKPWVSQAVCERHKEHAAHEFVTHCQCWESNPALVRKRDAAARYAAEPTKARR